MKTSQCPPPALGPEPWQADVLQSQLWPLCCPVRWSECAPLPTGHWAEAEGAPQALAGATLQREAKAFPTDEQRGCLKGGGHKPGKEGTGSFLVTSETQRANIPAPCSSSALTPPHPAQAPGSTPANPALPFGVRRKNLEPKGVMTASSGVRWVQGHEAAITEG